MRWIVTDFLCFWVIGARFLGLGVMCVIAECCICCFWVLLFGLSILGVLLVVALVCFVGCGLWGLDSCVLRVCATDL